MENEVRSFLAHARTPLPQQRYLASPCTASSKEVRAMYIDAAQQTAVTLRQQGYTIYSPLAAGSHPIPQGWYHYDLTHVRDCQGGLMVLPLPGWEKSLGIKLEIAAALALGHPVEFLEPADYVSQETMRRLEDANAAPAMVNIEAGKASVEDRNGHQVPTSIIRREFLAGKSTANISMELNVEREAVEDAVRYHVA